MKQAGLKQLIGIFLAFTLASVAQGRELSRYEWKSMNLDIPVKEETVMPPVSISELSTPNGDILAEGKALFSANCVSCHGASGMGDGVSGAALNPPPRNFTQSNGWTNGTSVTAMYKTLQNGIANNGMPAFDYLPASDRIKLIHYVRSFNKDFAPINRSDLVSVDATYKISEPQVKSGQIPIKVAMKIMAEEARASHEDKPRMIAGTAASMLMAPAYATNLTGNAAEGKKIFAKFACATCHNVDNSVRLVGPSLWDVGAKSTPDEIKTNIMDPDSNITQGFPRGVMKSTLEGLGFYKKTSKQDIANLVTYLSTLKGK